MTKLSSIFRKISNVKQYNILTFPTHERYESQLSKTGHNFFSLKRKNKKSWNTEQVPVPENYFILPEDKVTTNLIYDFVLVQSRFDDQLSIAKQIKQNMDIPIIVLEHSLPPNYIKSSTGIRTAINTNHKIREIIKNTVGDVNVFISEFSAHEWDINSNNKIVIHYGIDTNTFCPIADIEKSRNVLTVANNFQNRPDLYFEDWIKITNGLSNKVVGDNPGLSKSAENTLELVKEYNLCSVYLNTARTPIPMSLLEAMSCGCAIVTVADGMMSDIIQNGVNGFISNNLDELRHYVDEIIKNDALRITLGNAARKTILDRFSESEFINNWNSVFKDTYEGKYQ